MYNFGVGDTKNIVVGGITHPVRIIGFNYDNAVNTAAGNKIGITFEFTNHLAPARRLHSTTTISAAGGWAGAELRGVLNNEVFNSLPNDLRTVIRPAVKESMVQGGNIVSTNDNLWILCALEYYNETGWGLWIRSGHAGQYEYYRDIVVNIDGYFSTTPSFWTRSVNRGEGSSWAMRHGASPATTARGISPAFGV